MPANEPAGRHRHATGLEHGCCAASAEGAAVNAAASGSNRSVLDLMSRSLSTMHGCMAQMQMERDPPDVLIGIPHDACAIYEFWRAHEMIELGRQAASSALDQFEAGN